MAHVSRGKEYFGDVPLPTGKNADVKLAIMGENERNHRSHVIDAWKRKTGRKRSFTVGFGPQIINGKRVN